MKRNRKYWKTSAKAALRGNWIIAIAGMLAYMAVNFLGNVLSLELFPGNSMLEIAAGQIFVFVVSLIAMVFGTGYSYMMLNMSRGREFSLGNLLYMFHNQPDRVLIAAFVMALLNTVSQLPIYFAVYLTDPGSTIEAQMNWMQMIMGIMILSVVLNVLITVPLALSFYLLADIREGRSRVPETEHAFDEGTYLAVSYAAAKLCTAADRVASIHGDSASVGTSVYGSV